VEPAEHADRVPPRRAGAAALALGELAEHRRADDRARRASAAADLNPFFPKPAGPVEMAAVRSHAVERGQQSQMDLRVSGGT